MKILRALFLILLVLQFCNCDNIRKKTTLVKHKKHIDFIKSNPDNIESAHILAAMSTTYGKELTKELFSLLADSIRNSEDGLLVLKYINLFENPQIGDFYTDFKMQTQNGDTLRLSNIKGKIILLEFWASWCKSCVYQIPNLVEIHDKFQENDFEILAVSYDEDNDSWVKTIKEKNMDWIHVSELKSIGNTAGLIYGISSIPDNFLIDKNGIIVARNVKGERLEKEIAKLIND